MRRRKQQPDSDSERRVAVSVDANSQELVVAGSEGDVEQVAGELEYVRLTCLPIASLALQAILGDRHYTKKLFRRPAFDE
jgi:hypothetical protein